MGNILDGVINKKFSRRNFLKASAIGAAGLTLPGCASNTLTDTSVDAAVVNNEGEWITAACWQTMVAVV